jgi:N-methylhydantoinase A/oxoprolinase/acetone carboxylase beta subunit
MADAEVQLGLDVGETHADAVAMDRRGLVLAKAKIPVTRDLGADLGAAMNMVVLAGSLDPARIVRVMVGTHGREFPSGQRALRRVAVLRIGSPLTHALPPLCTWPSELRARVSAGEAVVRGGAEYDGRSAAPLDRDAVARFLGEVAGEADSIAITSVFSPVAPEQELEAAELARRELGTDAHVSVSHEIGTVGLLERENATVLNGALVGAVEGVTEAVDAALESGDIHADALVTKGDGMLMTLQHALRFPVLTIGCGPASAMRGAAYLSGVQDGLVVDVGGSRTDVGALAGGSPRESVGPERIDGVALALRMPAVSTLRFGGGSRIDPRVAREELAASVDRTKAELSSSPLVAVGGANALVPNELPGVSEVIRPPDGDVAGAIGAVVAPVGGYAERISSSHPAKWQAALDAARISACARAVHAGADPATVTVVHVEEVPLAYLSEPAIRIRVRAAGPAG